METVHLVSSHSLYIPCLNCGAAICRWLTEHKWHILLHTGRLECVSSIITGREQCRRWSSMSMGWQTLGSLRVVMFSQRCGWGNITLLLGRDARHTVFGTRRFETASDLIFNDMNIREEWPWRASDSWRWDYYGVSKRLDPNILWHGVTSQKNWHFIVISVESLFLYYVPH